MNEFAQLNALYANDMVRQRQQTTARARTAVAAPRRTTRRQVASGLRRVADRLGG